MWAALLSTAINAGTAIAGKNRQAKEQRAYNKWLNEQNQKLDSWYNKESNTNYLDTAAGQSQYNGLRRLLKENTNRVDNTLIKTGATPESNLAAKEQANETVSNAVSQMAAQDTQRKQYLQNMYFQQKNYMSNMVGHNMQGAIEGSANTSANGMAGLGNSLQSLFEQAGNKK